MTKLKSAAELGISERHRINIARLTIGVRKYWERPEGERQIKRLEMKRWVEDMVGSTCYPGHLGCGTSACFAGHAPYVGLGAPKSDESWSDFTSRKFTGGSAKVFNALFDSALPGTAHSATMRAAYLLQEGFAPREPGLPNMIGFEPDWEAIGELAGPTEEWLVFDDVV